MPFSSRSSSSSSSFSSSRSYSSPSRSSFSSYKSTATVQSRPPAVGTATQARSPIGVNTYRPPVVGQTTVYHPSAVTYPYHQTVIVNNHTSGWGGCSLMHPLSPCSAWAPWSIWHTQQPVAVVGQPGYVPQQYPGYVQSGPGVGFFLLTGLICTIVGVAFWRLFRR